MGLETNKTGIISSTATTSKQPNKGELTYEKKPTFKEMAENIFSNYQERIGKKAIKEVSFDKFGKLFPYFQFDDNLNLEEFDKNANKNIDRAEVALILETAYKKDLDLTAASSFSESGINKLPNKLFKTLNKIDPHLDKASVKLLKFANNADIPDEIRKKALERINEGNYNIYDIYSESNGYASSNADKENLTGNKISSHTGFALGSYIDQLNQCKELGIDKKAFDKLFFKKLAEDGEIGILKSEDKDLSLNPFDALYPEYTGTPQLLKYQDKFQYVTSDLIKDKKSKESNIFIKRNKSEIYSKKDFNRGDIKPVETKITNRTTGAVFPESKYIKNNDLKSSKLVKGIEEKLKGVLSQEELQNLYKNIDLTNPENLKANLQPVIDKMTALSGLDKHMNLEVFNDEKISSIALFDYNARAIRLNKASIDTGQSYLAIGLTKKQAHVLVVNEMLGLLAHEIVGHGSIESWKKNPPKNLSENDVNIVKNSTESQCNALYTNPEKSRQIIGSNKLYEEQPNEVFSRQIGDEFYTNYLNSQAFQ